MKRTRLRRASAMIRSAFSSWSASTRLLPIATPLAARKVFAIPPPTRSAWHRTSSASSTSSLPEIFAPPIKVWNGRCRLLQEARESVHLALQQQAGDARQVWVIPSVDGVRPMG